MSSYEIFNEYVKKTPEEINAICDTGMFNSIIEGYCRIVFSDLGVSERLEEYSFSGLFDFVSAKQAREKCK